MPLIPCPECGKEVSTSAKMCPHCGLQNPIYVRKDSDGKIITGGSEDVNKRKNKTKIGCFSLVCLAILLNSIFGGGEKKQKDISAALDSKQAVTQVCTPEQKQSASNILLILRQRGTREVVGGGAWYDWRENWYGMDFQRQMDTMRLIADTEYCVSNGKITHMHIDFNGEHVAEATPTGGIRVLKSRP
ncbi:zinc ribbon domain-containing protein [Desulfovibrio aminophilus]|uniref:zinc ribbon domain-containing protein n=1 Tax=Desulfovibrio aminophilus TaxID=81425 RepID=UPI0012EB14CE|nr:zinc ribbon domain-containing protein [Desulfovibrio aminophilus]